MTIIITLIKILESLCVFIFLITISKIFLQNKNINRKNKIILLISCIILYIVLTFIPGKYIPVNAIVIFFVLTILNKFIMKISVLRSAIMSISYLILSFLCEMFTVILLVFALGLEDTNQLVALPNSDILIVLTYYALLILISIITNFIIDKNRSINTISKFFKSKNFLKLLLILILTFIPQIGIIAYNRYNFSLQFLFFNLVQMVILFLYTLHTVYTYLEKEKFKQENEQLEIDNKAMSNLIDGVKAIKHDFNNIFQAIHGYVCIKDYTNLETYVSSVMKECNMLNNISSLNKKLFDDPGVYGVVGSKQFYANNLGILFEIDITYKVSNINFPKDQLCRILGIILDNAIEATSKVEDKNIRFELHFNKLKNAAVLKVCNSFNESPSLELSKIYDKGYSSKKVKSGIGLWEVKKFIDNNKNSQIYATIENNMFTQNIIIEN